MIGFGEDCRKEWVWMKTYLPTADVKSYFRGWTLKPKPPFSGGEKVRIAESETSGCCLVGNLPTLSLLHQGRPSLQKCISKTGWSIFCATFLFSELDCDRTVCCAQLLCWKYHGWLGQVFNFHGNLDSRNIYLVAGAGCWKHCKRCECTWTLWTWPWWTWINLEFAQITFVLLIAPFILCHYYIACIQYHSWFNITLGLCIVHTSLMHWIPLSICLEDDLVL